MTESHARATRRIIYIYIWDSTPPRTRKQGASLASACLSSNSVAKKGSCTCSKVGILQYPFFPPNKILFHKVMTSCHQISPPFGIRWYLCRSVVLDISDNRSALFVSFLPFLIVACKASSSASSVSDCRSSSSTIFWRKLHISNFAFFFRIQLRGLQPAICLMIERRRPPSTNAYATRARCMRVRDTSISFLIVGEGACEIIFNCS